jgi:four helix bundle protein
MDLVAEVYRVSNALPSEERFGLQSQCRRAAISIPANIAEGKGRCHINEYLNHLSIANGSLKELETHLFVMVRLGYVEELAVQSAIGQSEEIGKMLGGLRKSLQRSARC